MDDIENIIRRYKQELLEFSSQIKENSPIAIPTVSTVKEEPNEEIIVENPQSVAEETFPSTNLPAYSSYEEFIGANTERGTLRVQAFGGNQLFPIPGARVRVALALSRGNEVQQFDGLTDINGVVDNISLPAPPLSLSQSPGASGQRPFAYYTVTVEHPLYASSRFVDVPVFSNVKSVQNVQLVPLVGTGETPESTVQFQTEPFLKLREVTENGNTNRS